MAASYLIPASLALDGIANLDARAGFDLAAGAGYRGIAFATNHRELNPDALGETARRHVKTILAGKHLAIESLRAAGPRAGFSDAGTIDRTLENARKAIHLARELGVGTVSLNVGALGGGGGGRGVPESTIVAALRDLSQHADAAGLTLAVAADQMELLPGILKQVDFDKARLNLDGARLIDSGNDALQFVNDFGGSVGQFTAADAIRAGKTSRAAALGEGQLPLAELLALLREHGFAGPMVVDVRDLSDGPDGARRAAEILRRAFIR